MKKPFKAFCTVILSFTILLSSLLVSAEKENTDEFFPSDYNDNIISYIDYKNTVSDSQKGKDSISIDAIDYTEESINVTTEEILGKIAVITDEGSSVFWNFDVQNSGIYNITVIYMAVDNGLSKIQRELIVDGEIKFSESLDIAFNRVYSFNSESTFDLQGNEIRGDESEKKVWQTVTLSDIGGYTEENFEFEFTSGSHSVGFSGGTGEMAISNIVISGIQDIKPYSSDECETNDVSVKIQGEDYLNKSNSGILTKNDRSSAATEPSSATTIVYNTIGGESWSNSGDWIEWEVNVPEDGYYYMSFRYRQNTKSGGISSRMISIDGEVPFSEAQKITFPYGNKWQTILAGGEWGYKFYFTKGKHTIRLTANAGDMANEIATATSLLAELNSIYLGIVMIAGANPDLNRDYNFKAQIPDLIEEMKTVSGKLLSLKVNIDKISDGNQKVSEIERMIEILDLMNEDPESIAKRLSNFQSNISALATFIEDIKKQPLEIDYIELTGNCKIKNKKAGFFNSIVFAVKQLLSSFVLDYCSIGRTTTTDSEDSSNSIKAWMICGTEQAQVIQRLINESFIPETSVSVNAQNVSTGALMPAILSGTGPDVVMQLDEATPVNYALRGAVCDLNKFEDISEVLSQYEKCTYEAFELNGSLYALPLTVDYPVLFYRKDVMKQLNIDPQDFADWDYVLQVVLPKLQNKNLCFGLTASMQSYLMFYYQTESNLYNDDNSEILLSSKNAFNAFKTYSGIYTKYKQKLTFSFVNLFRTGEMPLAVMPYSQYYQLAVFAPEIERLWGIAKVPGTRGEDGELNHTVAATVTGASILSDTKNEEAAWTFLKWWTSGDTQSEYALKVETALGIAGRINPASKKAQDSISFTQEVKTVLAEQLDSCRGVPQVPGSYFVSRYFDFAFRDVVYSGSDIFQALISATDSINAEIKEKTEELQ